MCVFYRGPHAMQARAELLNVDWLLEKLEPVYDHYVWPTTHEQAMGVQSMDAFLCMSIACHALQLKGRLTQAGRMHAGHRRVLRVFLESEEPSDLVLSFLVSSFGPSSH